MKKIFNIKTIIFTLVASCAMFFTSCYSPNPLYGKWADAKGNQITFNPDLTYSAKIKDSSLNEFNYEGGYNVIENVIVFTRSTGTTVLTEWDIRGAILYLSWRTDSGDDLVTLSLYHTAK